MATVAPEPSFLATRRGKLTTALLCAIAFRDFGDASIVNAALASIRRALLLGAGPAVGPQRLPAHQPVGVSDRCCRGNAGRPPSFPVSVQRPTNQGLSLARITAGPQRPLRP
jgi:hypothetical protein